MTCSMKEATVWTGVVCEISAVDWARKEGHLTDLFLSPRYSVKGLKNRRKD